MKRSAFSLPVGFSGVETKDQESVVLTVAVWVLVYTQRRVLGTTDYRTVTGKGLQPRVIELGSKYDLTAMQTLTLFMLDRPCPMHALRKAFNCDASNITGVVDKLEARGLIARQAADHDRRVKVLVVTEKGRELRRKLFARAATPPAAIAALPQKARDFLFDVLRTLLAERTTAAVPSEG